MRRSLALLWVVVGAVIWAGFFDTYMERGTRQYLQLQAQAELGRIPPVSMDEVMAFARHEGIVAASWWAGLVVLCGWVTVVLAGRSRR